jgi:hypothetical protein
MSLHPDHHDPSILIVNPTAIIPGQPPSLLTPEGTPSPLAYVGTDLHGVTEEVVLGAEVVTEHVILAALQTPRYRYIYHDLTPRSRAYPYGQVSMHMRPSLFVGPDLHGVTEVVVLGAEVVAERVAGRRVVAALQPPVVRLVRRLVGHLGGAKSLLSVAQSSAVLRGADIQGEVRILMFPQEGEGGMREDVDGEAMSREQGRPHATACGRGCDSGVWSLASRRCAPDA